MKYLLAISLSLPSVMDWTFKWNGAAGYTPDYQVGAVFALRFRL